MEKGRNSTASEMIVIIFIGSIHSEPDQHVSIPGKSRFIIVPYTQRLREAALKLKRLNF